MISIVDQQKRKETRRRRRMKKKESKTEKIKSRYELCDEVE